VLLLVLVLDLEVGWMLAEWDVEAWLGLCRHWFYSEARSMASISVKLLQ
jgi:hypothetical protein